MLLVLWLHKITEKAATSLELGSASQPALFPDRQCATALLQGLRIELAGDAAVNWLEGVQAEALLRSPLAAPGTATVLPIAQVVEADVQVEMRCYKAFAAVRVSGDLA